MDPQENAASKYPLSQSDKAVGELRPIVSIFWGSVRTSSFLWILNSPKLVEKKYNYGSTGSNSISTNWSDFSSNKSIQSGYSNNLSENIGTILNLVDDLTFKSKFEFGRSKWSTTFQTEIIPCLSIAPIFETPPSDMLIKLSF